MITVITGTPGAGKTLYAITKLIQPLVGTSVPHEGEDGVTTMHPRTVYTNINGLLLDHELIDGGDNQGLRDWWTWAKPGSVIVFDEVQRIWQPRANGSKVPEDIQMLETQRHLGGDFVVHGEGKPKGIKTRTEIGAGGGSPYGDRHCDEAHRRPSASFTRDRQRQRSRQRRAGSPGS